MVRTLVWVLTYTNEDCCFAIAVVLLLLLLLLSFLCNKTLGTRTDISHVLGGTFTSIYYTRCRTFFLFCRHFFYSFRDRSFTSTGRYQCFPPSPPQWLFFLERIFFFVLCTLLKQFRHRPSALTRRDLRALFRPTILNDWIRYRDVYH